MKPFATTASNEAGKGILVCSNHQNQTKFERIHAQYPLKFIPTQGHSDGLAVVYMLSYGGGVISGDAFDIEIQVKPNAILLLLTQGNTKIFKDREGPTSIQQIRSEVEGVLLVLPDPVTCFGQSSFRSRQMFELKEGGQLVMLDWFTSGRASRGESWAFRHYSSRIDVKVGGRWVVKDAMVLGEGCGDRLKPYMCFATLIILSDGSSGLLGLVRRLQKKTEDMRLMPLSLKSKEDRQVLWSVSPIMKGKGVLVRVAGMTTELVRDFVKYECLSGGLEQFIGEGMFSKILM